jgi:KaiC/GvpD/RAD55 family RecA-like ATPase
MMKQMNIDEMIEIISKEEKKNFLNSKNMEVNNQVDTNPQKQEQLMNSTELTNQVDTNSQKEEKIMTESKTSTLHIVKSDGDVESFSIDKIKSAMKKAFIARQEEKEKTKKVIEACEKEADKELNITFYQRGRKCVKRVWDIDNLVPHTHDAKFVQITGFAGVGKSTFLTQVLMQLSMNKWVLNDPHFTTHNDSLRPCILVALEGDQEDIQQMIDSQYDYMLKKGFCTEEDVPNVMIISGFDALKLKEDTKKLAGVTPKFYLEYMEYICKTYHPIAIGIDYLGLWTMACGCDINSNTAVASAMQPWKDLSKKYDVTIYFLNQENKTVSGGNRANNINGAMQLIADAKVQIELVKADNGKAIYMNIVKSNYLKPEELNTSNLLKREDYSFSLLSRRNRIVDAEQEQIAKQEETKRQEQIAKDGAKQVYELLYKEGKTWREAVDYVNTQTKWRNSKGGLFTTDSLKDNKYLLAYKYTISSSVSTDNIQIKSDNHQIKSDNILVKSDIKSEN